MHATEDAPQHAHSGLAYIEMLRYAPCIVPFEDRAMVFQALIAKDKAVRIPAALPVASSQVART